MNEELIETYSPSKVQMYGNVLVEAGKLKNKYGWRIGQAVFNVAMRDFPSEVTGILFSDDDCYYNDNKVEQFMEALYYKAFAGDNK